MLTIGVFITTAMVLYPLYHITSQKQDLDLGLPALNKTLSCTPENGRYYGHVTIGNMIHLYIVILEI